MERNLFPSVRQPDKDSVQGTPARRPAASAPVDQDSGDNRGLI
jgi:hypothetical protein